MPSPFVLSLSKHSAELLRQQDRRSNAAYFRDATVAGSCRIVFTGFDSPCTIRPNRGTESHGVARIDGSSDRQVRGLAPP